MATTLAAFNCTACHADLKTAGPLNLELRNDGPVAYMYFRLESRVRHAAGRIGRPAHQVARRAAPGSTDGLPIQFSRCATMLKVAEPIHVWPQLPNITHPVRIRWRSDHAVVMRLAQRGPQITGEWRYSQGLTFLASYTHSKAMDVRYSSIQNSWDRKASWGPTDTDLAHTFIYSYIYDLPWLRSPRQGFAGHGLYWVLGGWELSGIMKVSPSHPKLRNRV